MISKSVLGSSDKVWTEIVSSLFESLSSSFKLEDDEFSVFPGRFWLRVHCEQMES